MSWFFFSSFAMLLPLKFFPTPPRRRRDAPLRERKKDGGEPWRSTLGFAAALRFSALVVAFPSRQSNWKKRSSCGATGRGREQKLSQRSANDR